MNKRVLQLAIPNIVSNLSVPLLGAVDTAVVGRLEHVYYLGAIAVGSIIFDFIFWGFGFLRMGTTGLAAQAFGADNRKETTAILIRALLVAIGGSVFILLTQYGLIEFALSVIDASVEIEQHVKTYFYIRVYAAPATLSLFCLNGWFLGMQNARYPMAITIVLNLCNIGFNLFFVFVLGKNVDGVAWGSVLASYIGLVLAVFLLMRKYPLNLSKLERGDILDWSQIRIFFDVNRDIFIRTLCLIFSYAFFTAKSAEFGDTVLAANTILLQLWYISAYGVDGFAFAAESLVGRYKGAADKQSLDKAIRLTMMWGIVLGLGGTLCYWALQRELIILFTNKTEVIEQATRMVIWLVLAPVINSVCFIWDGIYIGATATEPMRNSMLIATILFFVPCYYLAVPYVGVHALWLAMTAIMVVRGVTL
ncbi:MAG: MATE family efflux transporter, partial [Bacteroidota bacterium]